MVLQSPTLPVIVTDQDGNFVRRILLPDPRKHFCELFNAEHLSDPNGYRADPDNQCEDCGAKPRPGGQ
jgi:hypothetical protein